MEGPTGENRALIVIADQQLAAELDKADRPVAILKRDGRRLGTFTPAGPDE